MKHLKFESIEALHEASSGNVRFSSILKEEVISMKARYFARLHKLFTDNGITVRGSDGFEGNDTNNFQGDKIFIVYDGSDYTLVFSNSGATASIYDEHLRTIGMSSPIPNTGQQTSIYGLIAEMKLAAKR